MTKYQRQTKLTTLLHSEEHESNETDRETENQSTIVEGRNDTCVCEDGDVDGNRKQSFMLQMFASKHKSPTMQEASQLVIPSNTIKSIKEIAERKSGNSSKRIAEPTLNTEHDIAFNINGISESNQTQIDDFSPGVNSNLLKKFVLGEADLMKTNKKNTVSRLTSARFVYRSPNNMRDSTAEITTRPCKGSDIIDLVKNDIEQGTKVNSLKRNSRSVPSLGQLIVSGDGEKSKIRRAADREASFNHYGESSVIIVDAMNSHDNPTFDKWEGIGTMNLGIGDVFE